MSLQIAFSAKCLVAHLSRLPARMITFEHFPFVRSSDVSVQMTLLRIGFVANVACQVKTIERVFGPFVVVQPFLGIKVLVALTAIEHFFRVCVSLLMLGLQVLP